MSSTESATSLTRPAAAPTPHPHPPERGAQALVTGVRQAPWGVIALALVVGAGAGLCSIGFRWLIEAFTHLFSGHADYAGAGHAANPYVPWLGPYFVVLAPVVGGLLYGPLVDRFAKEARGHGVPEVMLAVARRGGRIKPSVSVVKALASALCIGSGGSVGREGPIVQIGAALGSTLGRVTKVTEGRMRLLVACGAAGGIAATFNAPLAGVFFAMELILTDFAVEAFGAVVLASVAASVIGRAAFGDTAFLSLPPFHVDHLAQYPLFALLGIAAGVLGVGFTRLLYLIEDACDWAWRGPEWLRPAVGGLLLGGVLLVLPEMYGVGYPVLEKATEGGYAATFLLLLIAGKILATSLTIGIGGSGGVFAPSLFIGAMLGSAYGIGVHHLLPGTAGAVGAYALVGMGAVFAGSSRAPITAVVILFELTGQYSIILPMMLAIVTATFTSRLLSRDTVYTLKLRRRGIDLHAPGAGAKLARRKVSDVMEEPPEPLPAATPLADAARRLSLSAHGVLPVLDDDGRYLGTLTTRTAAEALADRPDDATVPGRADGAASSGPAGATASGPVGAAGSGPAGAAVPGPAVQPGDGPARPAATAGDLAAHPAPVTAGATLATALQALASAPGTGLPVLTHDRSGVAGWITHQGVLRSLHAPAQPQQTPA